MTEQELLDEIMQQPIPSKEEMGSLARKVSSLPPDVRQTLIDEVKTKLQNGYYSEDATEIAYGIIDYLDQTFDHKDNGEIKSIPLVEPLAKLSKDEEDHLIQEFEDYAQRYPRE
jgi:anti-sigma28 factor (negative regulator of flagellin synthesis)